MPTIGEMRHRVTIEQKTRGASDGAGGAVSETWTTFAECWAKLDPQTGREIVAADQNVHRLTHRVTIRHRAGVTAAMRIRYQGRTLAILGLRELLENGRWLEIMCEEGAPS